MVDSSRSVNPYAPPAQGAEAWLQPDPFPSYEPPADRGTRLVAYFVDNLLYAIPAVPGFITLIAIGGSPEDEDTWVPMLAGLVFLPMLMLAIYQWYLVATTGQSLAKRWFKIRIVRMDGSVPGFINGVFLRTWVIAILNGICNLVGLVDALMIFGEESRCLHDLIANTKVIKA